jgi:hypothetical protein
MSTLSQLEVIKIEGIKKDNNEFSREYSGDISYHMTIESVNVIIGKMNGKKNCF